MNTDALKILGMSIAAARENRGLTQEDLAALIDMTPRVVQYYEAGDTNPPSETLFKIAKALGMSAPELIEPMWKYWLDNQA